MSKSAPYLLLFIVFPIAIASGMFVITDYANRPGHSGEVAPSLNLIDSFDLSEHGLQISANRINLLLFYHPHCPCTVSTLKTLKRISSDLHVKPNIIAVAFCPGNEPNNWIGSTSTNIAENLPDVTLVVDHAAAMCRSFGVKTSGHVLLYDSNRQLVFSGGITPGRGHEGVGPATSSLIQSINESSHRLASWPVFGCPILSDEASSQ